MKTRTVLAGLSAIALLGLPVAPAQASVPRLAITCGMVVTQDAHLYLREDLHCPDFGVRVQWGNPDLPDPIPDVTVDLRGHTLRGSGVGRGIVAAGHENPVSLQVRNGRVENLDLGAGGDSDTEFTNVKLVDNGTGFFCNMFCSMDHSRFEGNSVGLAVGGEGIAVVTHSVFSNKQTGADHFAFPSLLTIEHSRFFHNDMGLHTLSSSTVSHSIFARNGTGVLVEDWVGGCVTLHKDRFLNNDRDVVGLIC